MYSRESVGPRIEPWGTPALTGYSCDVFLSKTTWSSLLLRKDETWRKERMFHFYIMFSPTKLNRNGEKTKFQNILIVPF